MERLGWKSLVLAGLLSALGLTVGCSDRQDKTVREQAREAGQEVGRAAEEVRKTTQEAVEGFKEGVRGEGVGGSGAQWKEDAGTGDKPGSAQDGKGHTQGHKGR